MCGPVAALGLGVQAASQIAGFAGQSSAVDDYNAAARQNAINASLAATYKYEDEGRRFSFDAKKAVNEAYDTVMQARRARGTALASAGTAGVDAGSISVNSIMSDLANQEAQSIYNFNDNLDDMKDSYASRTRAYQYEAMGRINSMPFQAKPSPIKAGLGIATAGLNALQGNPQTKGWLGFA